MGSVKYANHIIKRNLPNLIETFIYATTNKYMNLMTWTYLTWKIHLKFLNIKDIVGMVERKEE